MQSTLFQNLSHVLLRSSEKYFGLACLPVYLAVQIIINPVRIFEFMTYFASQTRLAQEVKKGQNRTLFTHNFLHFLQNHLLHSKLTKQQQQDT